MQPMASGLSHEISIPAYHVVLEFFRPPRQQFALTDPSEEPLAEVETAKTRSTLKSRSIRGVSSLIHHLFFEF